MILVVNSNFSDISNSRDLTPPYRSTPFIYGAHTYVRWWSTLVFRVPVLQRIAGNCRTFRFAIRLKSSWAAALCSSLSLSIFEFPRSLANLLCHFDYWGGGGGGTVCRRICNLYGFWRTLICWQYESWFIIFLEKISDVFLFVFGIASGFVDFNCFLMTCWWLAFIVLVHLFWIWFSSDWCCIQGEL